MAEALDAEHGGLVDNLSVRIGKSKVLLILQGRGDLLLERWSAASKLDPVEKAFGVKFSIEPEMLAQEPVG